METHYRRPGWFTTHVANRLVAFLTRRGISIWGSRVLEVRGRTSGEWRTTPVNVLTLDGQRYLVSARGHGQWVRNMRVAGGGELRVGRKLRTFTAVELPDEEKLPILRTYLEKWGWEVNQYFNGDTAKSSDEEIVAAAEDHPVFRITVKK